jgi:hypothetical protein
VRRLALTGASEYSGWHDHQRAIGVLYEVMGHAAEECGPGFTASARSDNYRIGFDARCDLENRFRDASGALFDKRIGTHPGRTQTLRALLRRSLRLLEESGLVYAVVTQAKPRAQARPGDQELRAIRIPDREDRRAVLAKEPYALIRSCLGGLGTVVTDDDHGLSTSSALVGSVCGWWFSVRRTFADAL